MDCIDNNTDLKSTEDTGKTPLVFIKFSGIYKAKPVCKS